MTWTFFVMAGWTGSSPGADALDVGHVLACVHLDHVRQLAGRHERLGNLSRTPLPGADQVCFLDVDDTPAASRATQT